tara:strand:+ start:92 stop:304 length:213 start_codon:yes stop_codon:yes gene_type:complete
MENATIHVRFAPNGTVTEISARPDALTPQQWFNWLSGNAANAYRAYAGGRGVFKLNEGELEQLQRSAMAS